MASYGTAKRSKTRACGMREVRILEVRGRRFVNTRARIFHCTLGSIQHKYSAPSAGFIVAHTAPCTSVLCSGTLHFLQNPSQHPRRLFREISGSRQLSSLQLGNERKYIALRSRSRPFARIHPPEKTFSNFGEKCFRADSFRRMRFRAKGFGLMASGKTFLVKQFRTKGGFGRMGGNRVIRHNFLRYTALLHEVPLNIIFFPSKIVFCKVLFLQIFLLFSRFGQFIFPFLFLLFGGHIPYVSLLGPSTCKL